MAAAGQAGLLEAEAEAVAVAAKPRHRRHPAHAPTTTCWWTRTCRRVSSRRRGRARRALRPPLHLFRAQRHRGPLAELLPRSSVPVLTPMRTRRKPLQRRRALDGRRDPPPRSRLPLRPRRHPRCRPPHLCSPLALPGRRTRRLTSIRTLTSMPTLTTRMLTPDSASPRSSSGVEGLGLARRMR
jgi:hypothetical protein